MTALASASSDAVDPIAERLADVQRRIQGACERAGRTSASVTLVAVTKTHPVELARRAFEVGLADLGESRVGELLAKQAGVPGARWHLVGRLQRRKVRDVVGRGVLLHALDRRSLADELSRRATEAGVVQRALVQVNVGGDPAKAGPPPEGALELIAHARELPNLAIEGLTTIPPLPPEDADAAEAARPHFVRLRSLRDRARERWPEVTHLSMGMSADFEAAVEEGATIVRLGTVLFGHRPDPEGPMGRGAELLR